MTISEEYRKRTKRQFLYNIAPIRNVCSILRYGILSHNQIESRKIPYDSLADERVQLRRSAKRVPGGLWLHDYANLYFNPRNPMLYTLKCNTDREYCLLQVDYAVIDLPGTFISNMNASSYASFMTPREALEKMDFSGVFASGWNDPDSEIKTNRSRRLCAEVLIPHSVEPEWIKGILVPNPAIKDTLINSGIDEIFITITEEKYLFFEK